MIRAYNRNISLNGQPFRTVDYYMDWVRSPRVNGKLVLQANPLDHTFDRVISQKWNGPGVSLAAPVDASLTDRSPPGFSWAPIDNQAYARFQGKLRKGSASLGVTLASWKQSRDMIITRSNHARRTLDSAIAELQGNRRATERLRREREPLANQILETEFGWRPLMADVQAALITVCDGVPPEWIGSRQKGRVYARTVTSSSGVRTVLTWDGFATTSYSARVQISNPNLWLLNRMGLINPATVAWDLVPWSFVVNWFINVNAMVSSVTDEVGLTVDKSSITRTKTLIFENDATNASTLGVSYSKLLNIRKTRVTGTALQPKWEVKVPELNWELAVIATSLVVQKIKKLNRLIRLL